MPNYSDLDPSVLKLSLSDGTDLKPSITTSNYGGGTPSAADEVKRSVVDENGDLKAGWVSGSNLKAGVLKYGAVTLGKCGTFNGSSSDLIRGGASLVGGTAAWTVFLRLNPSAIGSGAAFWAGGTVAGQCIWISAENDQINYRFWSGRCQTTGATLSTGTWYSVAVSYDGVNTSGIRIYVDGAERSWVYGGGGDTALNIGSGHRIGSRDGDAAYFNGYINDVQVHLSELSAANVLALHNQTGPTPDHWYKLNTDPVVVTDDAGVKDMDSVTSVASFSDGDVPVI